MTSLDKTAHTPAHSTNHLAAELTETIRLSAPMALTQLGQIAMMTTDLAFIGRLGDGAVAAAALGHTVFFISFTFGLGIVSAVAPLAAQAFGARDPRQVRRAVRTGLWAALFVSIPTMILPLRGEQILLALGQAPEAARLGQQYLLGLVWGMAPALWFIAIRGFMGAVKRPEPALWITLAAVPANALLVYLLLYGNWGLPRLGLFGAGLSTTIVNIGTFLAALWFVMWRRPFRKYPILVRLWHIDWPLMRQLAAIGSPISLSMLMEYGLFSSAALLMGLIGTSALAAHQVALQVTAILFMVPLGIGMAATVRVGHAVGRSDVDAIQRAGFVALWLGISLAVALTVVVMLWRVNIAELFFGGATTDGVIELTAALLLIGATYFITDAIQTIAAGALRGLNDTRVPLVLAAVSYWLIGFTLACVLGFKTNLGAIGVWIGLSCGTAVYAAALILRFRRLASRFAA